MRMEIYPEANRKQYLCCGKQPPYGETFSNKSLFFLTSRNKTFCSSPTQSDSLEK